MYYYTIYMQKSLTQSKVAILFFILLFFSQLRFTVAIVPVDLVQ